MNKQASLNSNSELDHKKKPILLTILVVLSAIYITSNLFGIGLSIMNGPLSEDVLEERLSELYSTAAELKENQLGEDFSSIVEVIIQSEIYTNNQVFYKANYLALLTLIIGGIGVFLMFNLKKIGFHIYIIYSLLPILTMYLITPVELISSFLIVLSVITSAVFAILYGLNLKHMN